MTQVERIREYYRDNPTASYEEASQALNITYSNVKGFIWKDTKRGYCQRGEDKSVDYSPYFSSKEAVAELVEWKDDTRREWIEMLTAAAEKETDTNTIRLLIKEANKLMSQVTK